MDADVVKKEPDMANGVLNTVAKGVRDGEDDVEIDILGFDGDEKLEPTGVRDPDDTESAEQSSSFGNTFSHEDSGCEKCGDVEVNSRVCVEVIKRPSSGNEFKRVFRKKKLTEHWRNFIRPLMWRCHWLELRINELQSQAFKYDQELAKYAEQKRARLDTIRLHGSCSRSVPFDFTGRKNKIMKRKRRKRIEDTVNMSAYMSQHNVFSYYENKKSEADCHSVNDDIGDLVDEKIRATEDLEGMNEWLMSDDSETNCLEQILLNIDHTQSRIFNLKARLSTVRQTWDVLYPEPSGQAELPSSCRGTPSPSYGNNGDPARLGMMDTSPQHISGYETEDAVLPGSTVSSFGDAADTGIIETAAPSDQIKASDLCKQEMEDVLVSNRAAEEELHVSGQVGVDTSVKPVVSVKQEPGSLSTEEESTAPLKSPLPEIATGVEEARDPQLDLPVKKSSYTGKRRGRKPKRKRRGGVSGDGGSGGIGGGGSGSVGGPSNGGDHLGVASSGGSGGGASSGGGHLGVASNDGRRGYSSEKVYKRRKAKN